MKPVVLSFVLATCSAAALSGCAGGAQEAAAMPTPILCKTVFDLSPAYVRYNEYLNELKKRGEDCHQYAGSTTNIRVR